MAEKGKSIWLKIIVVLLGIVAMLGIFQLQTFFPGNGLRQRVIRLAIEISAFVVVPLAAWVLRSPVWRSQGEKGILARRWIRLFVFLAVGLPIINFWLIPFIFRHPSLADPVSRLLLWAGDWLPVFVAIPIVAYSIWRQHRLHS